MSREAGAAALMLLVVSLPALALPSPSPGPFLGRGPILIDGDANFTAANGVVAGNGTAGDPYVIAGWSIWAGSTFAIRVHNVTQAFVIRDNEVTGSFGIQVEQASGAGLVLNNKIVTDNVGISVVRADPAVVDNSVVGAATSNLKQGITLVDSNARVEGNAFILIPYAIQAHRGSPVIRCNDIHDDVVLAGVKVYQTTNATIECNTITSCAGGIVSLHAIGTVVVNNTVTTCAFGLDMTLTKDAVIVNNTFRFSAGTQVRLWHVSGVMTGNVVVDGHAEGVVMDSSPMLVANNTISNHLLAGLRLKLSAADVEGNVLSRNAVGIAVEAGSAPRLRANVMANNTVGLDVPYEARQTVPLMEANLVNGVNVDGTLVASEQVYFYRAANVTIAGGVRDSGFSAGHFGSLTAQGNVVLYEVDTATVNGTLLGHATFGVTAINSFNVVVQGASIVQAHVGVHAQAIAVPYPVPPCVVSVKDTNVTIPVDPVGTVGIQALSCRIQVFRTNVSLVDTGVHVDANSPAHLVNVTVTQAKVGLDVAGVPHDLNVTGSVFAQGRIGALVGGSQGDFVDSRFENNTQAGMVLRSGASLRVLGSRFSGNGAGMIDTQPCGAPRSCSSVQGEGNVFAGNLGDGARVNGTTSWRGDAFTANRGSGAVLGSATLLGVRATGNDRDGVEARGTFTIRGSSFDHNGRHGATLSGGGSLRDSTFSWNVEAGLHLAPTRVEAFDLDVSRNLDGIRFQGATSLPTPDLSRVDAQTAWDAVGEVGPLGTQPLDIHRSRLVGNARDAIRAGVAAVNATANYWGSATGPAVSVADQVGAFRNGVSATVRFLPWYEDAAMTTLAPAAFI